MVLRDYLRAAGAIVAPCLKNELSEAIIDRWNNLNGMPSQSGQQTANRILPHAIQWPSTSDDETPQSDIMIPEEEPAADQLSFSGSLYHEYMVESDHGVVNESGSSSNGQHDDSDENSNLPEDPYVTSLKEQVASLKEDLEGANHACRDLDRELQETRLEVDWLNNKAVGLRQKEQEIRRQWIQQVCRSAEWRRRHTLVSRQKRKYRDNLQRVLRSLGRTVMADNPLRCPLCPTRCTGYEVLTHHFATSHPFVSPN